MQSFSNIDQCSKFDLCNRLKGRLENFCSLQLNRSLYLLAAKAVSKGTCMVPITQQIPVSHNVNVREYGFFPLVSLTKNDRQQYKNINSVLYRWCGGLPWASAGMSRHLLKIEIPVRFLCWSLISLKAHVFTVEG